MTYRIKVPAKTLPVDEAHLLSGVEHALLRLQDYRRPLLVGLGVFLIAIVVVGGVLWFDRQAVQKAQELEREAMLHILAAANNPQKAEASLKQAIATYRQVADQYPRTPTAPLALFQAGNALVQANDLGGAIEAYQRFIALYGSNPGFAGLVQQRLAYAYLLKGDREQAVKALTSILEMPSALNRDQALFELARIEESQSRPEGATAHYQELIKSYPNSPFASEAMIRTKILDVKKTPDPATASSPVSQTPSGLPPATDKK
ncbi:MAG TPA: tetratricopeptide repeat protein [Nitrospiraceae bacterium]